jgi:alkylation response protein AidB-like acyl-CoA dehydrogenase
MNATISAIATSDPTDAGTGLREPVDAATILDNVRALDALVQQEAAPSNAQHFMTERMGRALAAAGVYRAAFPSARGGPEMSLLDQTRLVEMIARRDASIAWNATVLLATGFYATRLGDAAFAELYPDLDRPTCGSFHPKGVARQVEGGYLVTGDWKFGSAIRSSYHIVAGAEVVDAAGEPVRKEDESQLTLGVWLPVDAVTLRDDWHTIGLRGSGSQGYAVTDAFVPADHSFDRFFAPTADAAPLAKHVDLPFYSMAGISVGIAQHALDVALADLRSRPPARAPGERSLGLLGEIDAYVRAARALVYECMTRIDEAIFTPGVVPSAEVLARGDAPLANEFARIAVDRCADLVGSKVVYESQPLEQLIRDLAGVSAHASTWRSRWVDVGRTLVAGGGGG